MVLDNLAELVRITASATQRFPQERNASLVLDDQFQHDLIEIGPMIPAVALGDVHHLGVRGLIAVRATINMKARTVEVRIARTQSQPLCGSRCNEAVEFGDSISVERIQGTTKGVIVELFGGNAGRNEAGGGLVLEEPGDEVERMVDKSQAIEHHRFDGFTYGEVAHFRVLLRRFVNNVANANQEENLPTPKITQILSRACGMSAV